MQTNVKFKNYYDVNFKIKNTIFKIGKLSDYQLSINKHSLKRILKPSKEQLEQLEAIEYIIKQRSLDDQRRLIHEFKANPIKKAKQAKQLIIAKNTADVIETWLKKVTKIY